MSEKQDKKAHARCSNNYMKNAGAHAKSRNGKTNV